MKKIFNALIAVLLFASAANAATLPDTGCDIAGTITAAINTLAMWVGYAVGGYFAFMLVTRPLRYAYMATRPPKHDPWQDSEEYKQYCRDNRV